MGMRGASKRLVLELVGWTLVLLGIAALVLPGPGLLLLFAGLLVLSQQYEWAERRMHPVRERALKAAKDGVATWWRILLSTIAALGLVAIGVLWGLSPAAPAWWPVHERYWLVGGWGTGASLIFSGLLALALLVWSWRTHR